MEKIGMQPDPWQDKLLRSNDRRTLLLAGRQSGKSMTTAALAVKVALTQPPALILLLSPSMRQSGELFRDKLLVAYAPWRKTVPPVRETALTLELSNGSRVVSLPESEGSIRGYSGVAMIIIDEASRVSDDLYRAVRPMLAVSGGRLIAMTTPFGKRGWFFEEWISDHTWNRIRITADMNPRISPEFLEEERQSMGERFFLQEYFVEWSDTIDSVFSERDIEAAMSNDVQPLQLGSLI